MNKFFDSYNHYRNKVGCRRLESIWRSFAYEFLNWPDGVKDNNDELNTY